MDPRLAPATLLAGVAAGVATVAVHQWWWGLLLGATATVLLVATTPAGWATRLPLAVGFDLAVVLSAVPRSEGDYLLAATASGYAVLGLALLVLVLALSTLPRPGRRPSEGKPGSG